jgi:hypothetical protein
VNKTDVVVSCGSYGRGSIYILKKDSLGKGFAAPVVVAKDARYPVSPAMTELSGDNEKNLILTWQHPHQAQDVWMSGSIDGGSSWQSPLLITTNGNLLSAAVGRNNMVHCIYSDFTDRQFKVLYKAFKSDFTLLQEKTIRSSVGLNEQAEYIGAFQKLLVKKNRRYAFWIDYPGNSSLKFSRWKD